MPNRLILFISYVFALLIAIMPYAQAAPSPP
jgi:hypothetical protein